MGRNGLLVGVSVIFALLLLLAPLSFADESFGISAIPDKDTVLPGDYVTFNVTVQNNLAQAEKVQVLLFGENLAWITMTTYTLDLASGGTESFPIYVSPAYGSAPKTYTFTIQIRSLADKSVYSEKTAYFYVMEKEAVEIVSLETDKASYLPGEEITITAKAENVGTREASGYSLKINVANREMVTELRTLGLGDVDLVTEKITLDRYSAKGDYRIVVSVLDENNKTVEIAAKVFNVAEQALIDTTQDVIDALFYKEITITAKNEGNVRDALEIKEPAPPGIGWVYSFDQAPDLKEGNYVWTCELEPAATCTISFRVNYWLLAVIIIAAAGAIGLIIKFLSRPIIKKTATKRKGVWTIHLDAKNRSVKTLEDVEVTDHAPTILKLLGEFTIKPSETRKTKRGATLIWKIGRLEPGEERVISYKAKVGLEVAGGISLQAARITAQHPRGWKFVAYSRRVQID